MDTTALVPVPIGACTCPGSPHGEEGDIVYLRPKLDLRGGIRVKRRLLDVSRAAQMRDITDAFRSGAATVHQLADKYRLKPSEIQEVLDGKGDFAHLLKADPADLEIALAESYLDEGVAAWNLLDEAGTERPLTPESLRVHLNDDYGRAEIVTDKADDLFRSPVLDPLLLKVLNSLPPLPTNGQTHPMNGRGSKRKRRSSPSSTSATAATPSDIETTSPPSVGASSG